MKNIDVGGGYLFLLCYLIFSGICLGGVDVAILHCLL